MTVAELLSDFGPPAWLVLTDGAMGRDDLDKLYRKHAPKSAPSAARLQRHQVVGAVVGHSLKTAQNGSNRALGDLIDGLAKRSRTESNLLNSLSQDDAVDRLSTYGGMQFKRQRARMIWAALSDPRAALQQAALKMLGNLLKAAASGEETVRLPAPSSTSKSKPIPGLADPQDSAKLGKLRRSIKEKDAQIEALRSRLEQALSEQATQRGTHRRVDAQSSQRATDHDSLLAELQTTQRAQRETLNELKQTTAEVDELKTELIDHAAREKVLAQKHQDELSARDETLRTERSAWHHERKVITESGDGEERHGVVVLFDAANLGAGARAQGGHLDFAAVLHRVLDGRSLRRAIAFAVADPGPQRQSFEETLRRAGVDVRWKQKQTFDDGSTKADWDVGLAVCAMQWAGRAQTIIIASGDGDFIPLIGALKRQGTETEAVGWPGRTHRHWHDQVTLFTALDVHDLIRS